MPQTGIKNRNSDLKHCPIPWVHLLQTPFYFSVSSISTLFLTPNPRLTDWMVPCQAIVKKSQMRMDELWPTKCCIELLLLRWSGKQTFVRLSVCGCCSVFWGWNVCCTERTLSYSYSCVMFIQRIILTGYDQQRMGQRKSKRMNEPFRSLLLLLLLLLLLTRHDAPFQLHIPKSGHSAPSALEMQIGKRN